MSTSEKIEVDPPNFPLDRYEPLILLGQGSVGDVYKCYDRVLKKNVAVKCLRLLSAPQLLSFQNEARLLSSLQHKGVVKVLDFGTTNGSAPYMVMEFIEGVTLERFIKEGGACPVEQAIDITIAVCDALSYLHRHGCFHRDLKPANIVIVENKLSGEDDNASEIRLIDFGLADVKCQLQEPTIVQGRTIVGTPAFMSPDQINGERFDNTSEVYSLGAVLFFILTGEAPFSGESPMDVFSRQMNEDPPRLSAVYPQGDFSERLERIVARCLSRDRAPRFHTVEEVKEALLELTGRSYATEQDEIDDTRDASLLTNRTVVVTVAICSVMMASVIFSYFVVTPKAVRNNDFAALKSKIYKPRIKLDSHHNILRADGKMLFAQTRKGTALRYASADAGVTDADLKILKDAPPFGYLDISRTEVTGDGIKHLVHLPIHSLDVADLNLTEKGVEYISKMSQLRKIDLGFVPVSGERLKKLVAGLKKLEVLIVDQCSITDDDLKTICALKNLKVAAIQNSNVTYKGLQGLASLPKLSTIQLSGSSITDNDLRKLNLERFPSLETLDLHACPKLSREAVLAVEKKYPGLTMNYSFSAHDPSTARMVDMLGGSDPVDDPLP